MASNAIKHILKIRTGMFSRNCCALFFPPYSTLQSELVHKIRPANSICAYNVKRCKYKQPSKVTQDEDDSDSDLEDNENGNTHSKLITGRMLSLRVDTVLKSGLGIARNKVETLFYENKIYVNGKPINKKSAKLHIGDEVDILKGNIEEPTLTVSRVVVKSSKLNDNNDGLIVKMERFKHLVIENNL